VTNATEAKADSAREQILRAAARQFAYRPYSMVSLDDILHEAHVTKGAMYFHFRSKNALAVTLVDMQTQLMRDSINELLARKLSGLETLVDISFYLTLQEIEHDLAKASLHLLEAIGRSDDLQAKRLAEWITGFTVIAERAADEGDLLDTADPADVSRLLVALYAGIRQTNDLGDAEGYLRNLQAMWLLVLPGIANPERFGYFAQFVRRRTSTAIKTATRC
jgi:TetR/AcrR family transcriptional repressor of nem operon